MSCGSAATARSSQDSASCVYRLPAAPRHRRRPAARTRAVLPASELGNLQGDDCCLRLVESRRAPAATIAISTRPSVDSRLTSSLAASASARSGRPTLRSASAISGSRSDRPTSGWLPEPSTPRSSDPQHRRTDRRPPRTAGTRLASRRASTAWRYASSDFLVHQATCHNQMPRDLCGEIRRQGSQLPANVNVELTSRHIVRNGQVGWPYRPTWSGPAGRRTTGAPVPRERHERGPEGRTGCRCLGPRR